jgi:plastocyanin
LFQKIEECLVLKSLQLRPPAAGLAFASFLLLTMPAFAAEQAVTVSIDNFTFTPREVTITPGTTVTWVNNDDIPHTVAGNDKLFRSKPLDTEDKFSFTFTTAGEFGYFCSLHPKMVGKITVKPAA